MKKKSEISKDMEISCLADAAFQCENCDHKFKTENGLNIHIGKIHKSLKETLSPEKICDNPLDTSLNVSPLRDTVREDIDTEEVEEVPTFPVEENVRMVKDIEVLKEDLEPHKLEFNDYRKWDTGDIPQEYMKVQLPKPPPMVVMHENYGLGEFIKTHPFGQLTFMKGPRSHQYTFKEGGRELYFLDPHP